MNIEHTKEYSAFQCDHPGLVTSNVQFEHCENVGGTFYWKAIEPVTHIFGAPVESVPLVGIGKTKELALQRLAEERKQFYESLWA